MTIDSKNGRDQLVASRFGVIETTLESTIPERNPDPEFFEPPETFLQTRPDAIPAIVDERSESTSSMPNVPVSLIMPGIVNIDDAYVPEDRNIETVEATKHNLMQTLKVNRSVKMFLYISLIIVTGSIVVSFVLVFASSRSESRPSDETKPNILDATPEVVFEISGRDVFKDPTSPQSKALDWMLNEDKIQIPADQKLRFIQRYISTLIYFVTGGENWLPNSITYLNASQHECDWDEWDWMTDQTRNQTKRTYSKGLHCNDDKQLLKINLYLLNISGTIPAEIGSLQYLEALNILGNGHLSGTIPSTLGKLTELRSLWISSLNLTGTIPTELQSLTKLETVATYGNRYLKDDMEAKICSALPSLLFFQSTCGNGTSVPVCSCCHHCCNPALKKCCDQKENNCYFTDPNEYLGDDDWW